MITFTDFFHIVLDHRASAEYLDIDRHAPAVWRRREPAEQWAGEQAWYSASGKLKHHEGISTFSIGALILAEKLDSTKVLSSIFRPPVVSS